MLAKQNYGFTFIELSIVLVIIGLIAGGVLVGRDLIGAAATRAQISQIEKFNTAANTFYEKYGYLPGDIPAAPAAQFGFAARGQYAGEGDGNGLIQCITQNAAGSNRGISCTLQGEQGMFWVDLSVAHILDGSFSTARPTNVISGFIGLTGNPSIGSYLPQGKIANSYVYVWSGGWQGLTSQQGDGKNYFALNGVAGFAASYTYESEAITVSQAYAIDKKVDDGMPQSGNVLAISAYWWAGNGQAGGDSEPNTYRPVVSGDGRATSPGSTTCYDNGAVAGGTEQYSITQNNGNGVNCALSFRMQAGN